MRISVGRRSMIAASVTALAAGIVVTPALAQTAPAAPAANDTANAQDAAGADIVVTAQRRSQRLQDAPVAVTALSNEALDQFNISDTRDLMTVVPSLQVSPVAASNSGNATFFLRGMGQQAATNGSEAAVGIYIDDFYYPSISGSVFETVDLDRVEVLRGPQGTLFGRNTIGGAIRYTTRRAELGKWSGSIKGTIGTYDRYDLTGALNVPIGDFAALNVSGGHLQHGGYVKVQSGGKDVGGTNADLVRLQLAIEPTSRLRIDLAGQYSEDNNDGIAYNNPGPFTPVAPAAGAAATAAWRYNLFATPRGLPLYNETYRSSCFYCQYGTLNREFSNTTYKSAQATVTWDLTNNFTLKSLTSWQDVYNRASNDQDSTPLPVFGGGITITKTKAFTQELQLNGKLFDDRLNFVSGLFYINQRDPDSLPGRANTTAGVPVVTTTLGFRFLKSYAAYIDANFALTDKLKLLGGYRYSEDHRDIRIKSVATGAAVASGSDVFKSNTYRAGLQYDWTSDIMTYVNVATGFRAGGYNPYMATQNPPLTAFEPETAITYEAGARMQFLNRRITINPTIFYTNWNKIQIQALQPDNTGTLVKVLSNAGTARSYGFELEWSASVSEAVRIFGTFAYLNLHYTDIGRADGITLNSDFQRAPPITFSLGGAHTLRLDSGAKIVSTINYSFQDDQRSIAADADALMLPAYGLLGGRIDFTDASGKFSIGLFGTNLLDKKYFIGGIRFSSVGAARWNVGRPREVGVSAKFKF
ncbi:MAG: TonB-dependent receptor [Sphingomonas sp.]|uniref:TonB-dependent receptor n=1 Tax=Sphingomonas sp. TaxID=28214 RepID=UPI001AC6CBD3|nr:TonB-dependent receptor [Sphingomonas sp.]MBN8814310.1 TonB-dependent receptor [Sphingomonas sp.]